MAKHSKNKPLNLRVENGQVITLKYPAPAVWPPCWRDSRRGSEGKTEMYRISWQSTRTDYKGNGEYVLAKHDAQRLCDQMNREFPEITHWIERKSD